MESSTSRNHIFDGPLMPMACHSIVLAPPGRYAVRSSVVSSMAAVAAMPSVAPMAEHMHGDEGNGDQYPDPVR